MVRTSKRLAWIALVSLVFVVAAVPASEATNCGTMADIGSGGFLPVYKIVTGHDPCGPATGTGAPQATISCTPPQLNALPQFPTTPPRARAIYHFGGTCTSLEKPGAHLVYAIEGKWTPTADASREPNASELITITDYELVFPGRGPGGQIYVVHTARCVQDPWITPNRNCQLYGAFVPDDVRAAWRDVDSIMQFFPWTADTIPRADKQRLLAEYNRVNGIMPSRPVNPATTRINAVPTVISPTPGQRLYAQSPLLIKVAPPRGWSPTMYWINLQRRDQNGQWVNAHNPIALVADSLQTDGYTGFVPDGAGAWRLNAQVSAPAVSSPSEWVEFVVVPPAFTRPAGPGVKPTK